MVKIRLTRLGSKDSAFYRVVASDSRIQRDGKVLEILGTYNPMTNPSEVNVDTALALKWLANGAKPTDTAKEILIKAGIKFKKEKSKVSKPVKKKAEKKKK